MAATTTTSSSTGIPSLKDLASSNGSLRRKNLDVVLGFLSGGNGDNSNKDDETSTPTLDASQCLQLWRGLSVALYMQDTKKMVIVQQLIATLAGTVDVMYARDLKRSSLLPSAGNCGGGGGGGGGSEDDELWYYTSTWTSAFWETMAREWSGMDQWRINKYLLLVRLVVRTVLEVVLRDLIQESGAEKKKKRKTSQGQSLLDAQLQVLEKWPLSSKERKVPDGLRLHVLDIWVEEVEKAAAATTKTTDDGEPEAVAAEEKEQGPSKKRKRNSDKQEKEEKEREERKKEMVARLMQPIRRLAKESLGKGVKVKAREIVRELDGGNGGGQSED